ncbi:uncharacterized protein J4E87_000849 [Alternaria ethzedia]|uniref:uncharacterized protein n=1 Tax=Alternaria ethzedia TaxID=181014 RepID=UPI0020C2D447|nr:uncharacterized protein J4E87_000849 [Alternaria ethzedia]KAI4633685.1 hypothetical protein J4E87_000849 [Alternaria ethzedia]
MPSHLTRLVFRNIIANEPLLYRGCRYRAVRPRVITQHGARLLPQTQRRTFFGELFKQKRKLKPAEAPPGLNTMAEVSYKRANDLRPPAPKDVADAIKEFFAQRKGTFEDWHVGTAIEALKYLLENPREDGKPWLSRNDLDNILEKLLDTSKRPEILGKAHMVFGKLVVNELAKSEEQEPEKVGEKKTKELKVPFEMHINSRHIQVLAAFGAATEARDIAISAFKYDKTANALIRGAVVSSWNTVLGGIIRENSLTEVSKTVDAFTEASVPLTRPAQNKLVAFYAERGDLEKAKSWYSQPVHTKVGHQVTQPSGGTSSALLKACAAAGDLTYGQQVVANMLKVEMPSKPEWDAIFLWSAAIGKGPDEIARMINVLIRRNDEARQKDPKVPVIRPDTETINALVEHCMSKQDPYLAERYIVLGEKFGIHPDETTYTMQMQYRISVGDLDGARSAYFNLQGSFSGDERSVAVVNELIQALCVSKQHHFDELMAMVDDLHERKASFAPETVAALTLLHLRRGEIHDAMDLLQVHAHQYSPEQRTIIQKALSMFILDGETSTADAWDGYQILRNVFVETPREDRIPIMNGFFARNRSDMACHVFFHMRNHVSPTHTATRDVYVAAFTGFARCQDAESLELAHNQLKLDLNVEMDTKLRNSLMLAYAATGENRKALSFWREICDSKEGPTYNSLAIAFRSSEGMHFGSEHAKSIWKRLKDQDVEIDKNIWTAYMCAVARNHNHDEALALVESVEEEYGFTPDLQILGSWFNCTANIERQTRVEAWIKQHYPKVWAEMEALGHWVTMDGFGYRQYNINRDLDP